MAPSRGVWRFALALLIVPAGANQFLGREVEPAKLEWLPLLEVPEQAAGSDRRQATEVRHACWELV